MLRLARIYQLFFTALLIASVFLSFFAEILFDCLQSSMLRRFVIGVGSNHRKLVVD
ncbi:hypothetical protein FH972_002240 [Carpinus fangiana]|uniref:Uncharacterized protein n=1 Tax=Carpinus fangiana TaxID=176857 RepID=A0A5N6QGX2_9ROSI|nr:hypothetical protein FH972_002240 [Carpinus fangiana]